MSSTQMKLLKLSVRIHCVSMKCLWALWKQPNLGMKRVLKGFTGSCPVYGACS
ncbi:hypothetical protein D3C71_1386660 [compost metagenome]